MVHIPWFMELRSATPDGKTLRDGDGQLILPASVKHVELRWLRRASTPDLSYEMAVQNYKAEYRKRYKQLLLDGSCYRWQPAKVADGSN